jgi:hypothetical protein
MRWLPRGLKRNARIQIPLTALLVVAALLLTVLPAAAFGVSLTGSNFEIEDPNVDPGANLLRDGVSPSTDWADLDLSLAGGIVKQDEPSGTGDNSFGQGTKEDSPIPAVVSGSIPPNKSDLSFFGVYKEENSDGKFLHLFWTRVQDPSGTTNMDFEFNQSTTLSDNGVTPVRTAGDLLVVYELAKGGKVPQLWLFTWLDGSEGIGCEASNSYPCWGDRTDLSSSGAATGSINTADIPSGGVGSLPTGGLGLSAYTFGEASIDLDFIFEADKCSSFGSVYLKSRSSDSFTSALKDFIAPQPVTLTNCGTVTIRKVTEPTGRTESFSFTSTVVSDPVTDFPASFSLKDGESRSSSKIVAGTGYMVTESDPSGLGFELKNINCAASDDGLVTSNSSGTVTFDMTVGGNVDCTFTNTAKGKIIVDKVTSPTASSQAFTFDASWLGDGVLDEDFSLTDQATPFDSGSLQPGSYSVAENPLTGWDLTSATCDDDDSSDPGSLTLDPGETISCTFTNTQQGSITIVKDAVPDDSQDFSFTGTSSTSTGITGFSLDDDADATLSNTKTISGLKPGSYSISETGVPGWDLTDLTCSVGTNGTTGSQDGSDPLKSNVTLTAGGSITCTFTNTQQGSIKIVKNTVGGDATFGFTSTEPAGETSVADSFNLTTSSNTAETTFSNLKPGFYSVTEDAKTGWDLTSATCSDGSDPSDIGLSAGESVTCTFTNTRMVKIIVFACYMDTNTLAAIGIDTDGSPGVEYTTISSLDLPGTIDESALCGLTPILTNQRWNTTPTVNWKLMIQ